MRNSSDSQPDGCGGKIVHAFFVIFFGAALIGSFSATPMAQRMAYESVCKPGTIVYDKWSGRRKTPTCIDRKTNRKTDVGIYEIFGCCPLGFVIVLIFIYSIGSLFFQKSSERRDNYLPPNFRGRYR